MALVAIISSALVAAGPGPAELSLFDKKPFASGGPMNDTWWYLGYFDRYGESRAAPGQLCLSSAGVPTSGKAVEPSFGGEFACIEIGTEPKRKVCIDDGKLNAVAAHGQQIVVGGTFPRTEARKTASLMKLDAAGEIDPTFATNVRGALGNDETVYAVAFQPDGKVLVGGEFYGFKDSLATGLVRLHPDGKVDAPFATALRGGFSGPVRRIRIGADGTICVAGRFEHFGAQVLGGVAVFTGAAGLQVRLSRRLGALGDRLGRSGWHFESILGVETDGSLRFRIGDEGCGNDCETCRQRDIVVSRKGKITSRGPISKAYNCDGAAAR